MKFGILVGAFLLAVSVQAADITAGVSTPHGVAYNKGYRDVKDGTNSETIDVVVANTFGATVGTTTFKTSGGYLDNITFEPCQTAYFVGDSSFSLATWGYQSAGYTSSIDTFTVTGSARVNIPYRVRFSNGLSVATAVSTCTARVSYR